MNVICTVHAVYMQPARILKNRSCVNVIRHILEMGHIVLVSTFYMFDTSFYLRLMCMCEVLYMENMLGIHCEAIFRCLK